MFPEVIHLAHSRGTTNVQSYPRDLKHLWIADPGHVLIWGDYEQIEAKLVAFFAQDVEQTEIVLSGGDLYAHAAAALYGCAPTAEAARQCRVDFGGQIRSAREAAKTFRLARFYWMGPRTFCTKHGIPEKEARRLIEADDARWPKVAAWRYETAWKAQRDKYLETPFGWRRYFWTPFRGDDIEKWPDAREAVSHLPQSSAASIFKRTLSNLPVGLVWAARHDEIVLHVPEAEAAMEAQKLKTLMEHPWPQLSWPAMYPNGFYCTAEVKIGTAWGIQLRD